MTIVTIFSSCKRFVIRCRPKSLAACHYIIGYIALFTLLIFIYLQTQASHTSDVGSSLISLPSASFSFSSLSSAFKGGRDSDNIDGRNDDGDVANNANTESDNDSENFFQKQQEQSDKNGKEIQRYFQFYNLMGRKGSNVQMLENLLEKEDEAFKTLIWSRSAKAREIGEQLSNSKNSSATNIHLHNSLQNLVKNDHPRTQINVATVACGKSTVDVMVMLKSLVMFSQDADLHVIIFGDKTLPLLAESVLELKWTVNTLGWDFSYELSEVWFPSDSHLNTEWKTMYALCATQRLFFPSLLPHVDSLIYLDADSIMVSNLTNFWMQFQLMNDSQVAAMAPNTEYPANGFYNLWSNVPYYGKRGLNAGVLLMNLTRARNFDFEGKALATYTVYKEKVQMADQDILNIIFHAYPEKLFLLPCTYNFIWAHCGEHKAESERVCIFEKEEGPICFCHSTLKTGVFVAHGNSGTFHKNDYPLFKNLYIAMSKFNLTRDSYTELYKSLKEDFDSLDQPCFYLTGEKMYANMKTYFQNIHAK